MADGKIQVPVEFLRNFDELCKMMEVLPEEVEPLKAAIRADFAAHYDWVNDTLRVYRYCMDKWGRLPSVDDCRDVLGPSAQASWFQREGILLLARRCADHEGK